MIFVLYLTHSAPKEITPACPSLGATLITDDAASLRPFQHASGRTFSEPSKIIYEAAHTLRSWICLSPVSIDWNIDYPDRIVSSYCLDRGQLFLLAVQLLLLRQ
jgi:hypothetical protein